MFQKIVITLGLFLAVSAAATVTRETTTLLAWDADTSPPAQIIQPVKIAPKDRVYVGHQLTVPSLNTLAGYVHAPVTHAGGMVYTVQQRGAEDGDRRGYFVVRHSMYSAGKVALAPIFIGEERPTAMRVSHEICFIGSEGEVGVINFQEEDPVYRRLNHIPQLEDDSQGIDAFAVDPPWIVALDQDAAIGYVFHAPARDSVEFEFSLVLPKLEGPNSKIVSASLDNLTLAVHWGTSSAEVHQNQVYASSLNLRAPMEGRPDMFKPLGVQTARSIRKNKGGLVTGRWQSDWVGVRTLKDMVFVSSGERGVIAFQMTSEGMVARKAFPWGGHTVHDMTEDNDRFTLLLRQQGGFADRCWVGVCHWNTNSGLKIDGVELFDFPAVRLIP
jgi:hypothetical protein